ncbi:MAG: hypothetical protein ACR2PJ_01380 [Pseudomonadales bacterium]
MGRRLTIRRKLTIRRRPGLAGAALLRGCMIFCMGCCMAGYMSGCTTNVVVEGSLPTPLVEQIPVRIGVHYTEDFRNFSHEEKLDEAGTWNIALGSQNLSFFQTLFAKLFVSVREVGELPLSAEEMAGLDGILVPTIAKYGFLPPAVSGLKFYSASIEYHVALYDVANAKVGEWMIVGYGKSEGGMFTGDDAMNEATMLAIRDGGARIAIELINQPGVQKWIKRLPQEGGVR